MKFWRKQTVSYQRGAASAVACGGAIEGKSNNPAVLLIQRRYVLGIFFLSISQPWARVLLLSVMYFLDPVS